MEFLLEQKWIIAAGIGFCILLFIWAATKKTKSESRVFEKRPSTEELLQQQQLERANREARHRVKVDLERVRLNKASARIKAQREEAKNKKNLSAEPLAVKNNDELVTP